MNINSSTSAFDVATSLADSKRLQSMTVGKAALLKEALRFQGNNALQLIQSTVPRAANPAHLGNKIDSFA